MSFPTGPRFRPLLFAAAVCVFLLVPAAQARADRAGEGAAKVYVILWFDTEDYLLPASDDAAMHLAQFLSGEDMRTTFKVVGEKARTLERRKRTDVIDRAEKARDRLSCELSQHAAKSGNVSVSTRLGRGVPEFDRREGPGRADVERIFGQAPTCYGQPGSSWGPQSYGAMRQWGMKVYLDAGSHVNLNDRPCYYCGALNLYKLAHTHPGRFESCRGAAAGSGTFAQAQGAVGGGRRRGEHLLSPLRVRSQEVLGRRKLFARREPSPRQVERTAGQDSRGDAPFLPAFSRTMCVSSSVFRKCDSSPHPRRQASTEIERRSPLYAAKNRDSVAKAVGEEVSFQHEQGLHPVGQ